MSYSETDDATEPDGRTPNELVEETAITGAPDEWDGGEQWTGPDYGNIPVPSEERRPKWEWDVNERRAYLYSLLRKYGTPENVTDHGNLSQYDLGDEFGVTQRTISNDYQMLRRYIECNAGKRAISDTEMVAVKAVQQELEDGNGYKALRAQLDYNDWLFDLGRLQRAPSRSENVNVNLSGETDDLNEHEQDQFKDLSEKLQQANDSQPAQVIDVEAKDEAEDEDDD